MSHHFSHFLKKTALAIVVLIAVTGLSVSVAPQPATAIGDVVAVVSDTSPTSLLNVVKNTITAAQSLITAGLAQAEHLKEFVLDPAAWVGGNLALQGIVNSTLNWALTGAHGSPTLVADLNLHLRNTGDTAITNFLNQLRGTGAAQSPFFDQIVNSVQRNYFSDTSGDVSIGNIFTLGNVSPNPQAFLSGDFVNGGGWDAFYSTIMHCSNNIYCASMSVQSQAQQRVAAAQSAELEAIRNGSGFAPIRSCGSTASSATTGAATTGAAPTTPATPATPSTPAPSAGTVALSTTSGCNGPITTGGALIASAVNHMLGLSADRQVQTDEIDEILANFIGNALFGNGGFLSLNQSGSSGNSGRSALEEQTNQNQTIASSTITGGSTTFLQSATGQRNGLIAYVADVQKIMTAANAANAALASCSDNNHDALQVQVNAALAIYTPDVVASTTAQIDSLNQIIAAVGASSDPATTFTAQQQYTALLVQIDPTKILQAHDDAADPVSSSGSTATHTVYGNMTQIAAQGCLTQLGP